MSDRRQRVKDPTPEAIEKAKKKIKEKHLKEMRDKNVNDK